MDKLLSIEEAAEALNVPTWTVRRLCQNRRISYVGISPRRKMFTPEQIRAFIDNATVEVRNPRTDKRSSHVLQPPRKREEKSSKSLREIGQELKRLCH